MNVLDPLPLTVGPAHVFMEVLLGQLRPADAESATLLGFDRADEPEEPPEAGELRRRVEQEASAQCAAMPYPLGTWVWRDLNGDLVLLDRETRKDPELPLELRGVRVLVRTKDCALRPADAESQALLGNVRRRVPRKVAKLRRRVERAALRVHGGLLVEWGVPWVWFDKDGVYVGPVTKPMNERRMKWGRFRGKRIQLGPDGEPLAPPAPTRRPRRRRGRRARRR